MLSNRESKANSIECQASTSHTKHDEITPDKHSKTKQTKSTRKRKRYEMVEKLLKNQLLTKIFETKIH